MLNQVTRRIYSILFGVTSCLHLVPFDWNSTTQMLNLYSNGAHVWVWYFMACIQFGHFFFLMIRLVNSIYSYLEPSVLLFQIVWNTLFLIPVLSQISTIYRKHAIAALISEWLQIEHLDKREAKNSLLSFFLIFLPTGFLHAAAHAFNFIENPHQPQYVISVFIKPLNIQSHDTLLIAAFGLLEFVLASLNWTLVTFYVGFLFGTSSILERKLDEFENLDNFAEALIKYHYVDSYSRRFGYAFNIGIPFMKIILFTCIVTCVYNTITRVDTLSLLSYLLMPLTVIACSTVYIFIFPPLCRFREKSVEVISKWKKRYPTGAKDSFERKRWIAFPPISIRIGPLYDLETLSVLIFFDVILNSVVNLILLFPAK